MKIDITTRYQAKQMLSEMIREEFDKIYKELSKLRSKIIELEDRIKIKNE